MEAANRLVVAGQRTLALAYVNFYRRLVVGCRREDLALAGRNRRVGVDELREHASERLDTERQRRHIKQQHILHFARQHTALDSGAHGNHLVGVYALVGRLAEELLDNLLHGGDTGRTADQNHLVDIAGLQTGVTQRKLAGLDRLLNQMVAQLLELGTRKRHDQVLRNAVYRHDVGQVDFGRSRRRKFNLGLLGSLLQALQSHRVLTQVDVVLGLERLGHVVDKHVVEVITSQVRIAVGRLNLEDTVAQLQDGDIERTATEVVYGNLHILALLVQTVGKRCGRRLVDDSANLQTGNLARLLRGLTLRVGEVGRHGDNRLGYLLAQIVLGRLLHLLQNDGRNLLRRVETSVDVDTGRVVVAADNRIGRAGHIGRNLVEGLAHETFNRKDRALRVGDGLTLCGVTHLALSVIREGYDGRGRAVSLGVGNHHGLVALHHCYAGVRRT